MSHLSWSGRVKEIVADALEAKPEDRKTLIDQACADDESLRRRVLDMISHQELGDEMLEAPAPGALFAEGLVVDMLAEDPLIGQTIDSYQVVERLGKGGMGTVYRAQKVGDFEQEVALKVIKRGMSFDDVVDRFRMERQILARIQHPNIASFLGGGSLAQNQPYFIMELIQGRPIDEYCDQKKLGLRARLDLFLSLCDAVSTAHKNLVVHRDLKPSNMLVTEEGVPKLLDFGIAKLLDDQDPVGVNTLAGRRMMTIRYASPEQINGDVITTASDVYSLGVVLFQLLSGHLPYRVETFSDEVVAHHVLEVDPKRPSTVVALDEEVKNAFGDTIHYDPKQVAAARNLELKALRARLSGDLDAIILKALEKDPARRYSSVEQLGEDIRRHLQGRPVQAMPPSFVYRTRRYLRRHRVAASVVGLFLATLSFYAVTLKIQIDEKEQARIEAESAKDEAIESEKEALTARDISDQVTQLLADLFRGAAPNQAEGKKVTVYELLEKGRESIDSIRQPATRAEFSRVLADVYKELEDFKTAEDLLGGCLDALEPSNPESLNLGYCKLHLGMVYLRQDRLDEAENTLSDATSLIERLSPEPTLNLAKAYSNLSNLFFERSNQDDPGLISKAAEYLQNSIDLKQQLLKQAPSPALQESLFISRNDLSFLRIREKKYQEGLRILEELIPEMQAYYSAPNTDLAAALGNKGRAQFLLGQVNDAYETFKESCADYRELFPKGGRKVVRSQINLIKAGLAAGLSSEILDEATQVEEAALSLSSSTTNLRLLGTAQTALAEVLSENGRATECVNKAQEAHDTLSKVPSKGSPWRPILPVHVGLVCQAQHDRADRIPLGTWENFESLVAAGLPETDTQRLLQRLERLASEIQDDESLERAAQIREAQKLVNPGQTRINEPSD